MEMSNENAFKVGYTSVFKEQKSKKEKWTSKIGNFINEHKIITLFMVIFCTCCTLNFVLIYNFVQILEKM